MQTLSLRPFYLMRHGQTRANADDVAAGALDTPLTERGRQDAARAAQAVRHLDPAPSRIVHSALSRTIDTARIVNDGIHLDRTTCAALGERSFGAWVGRPWDAMARDLDRGLVPPDGESMDDFTARIAGGFASVWAEHDQDWILFVLHGGVFHALGHMFGCRMDDVANGALYRFVPCTGGAFPMTVTRHDADGTCAPVILAKGPVLWGPPPS